MSELMYSLPWYRNPANIPPFSMFKRISLNTDKPLSALAFFPWNVDSLKSLWDGYLNFPDIYSGLQQMILEWSDAILVGCPGEVYVVWIRQSKKTIRITLPENENNTTNVAWALRASEPFEPLMVFSGHSIVYVFNLKNRRIVGYLRGHGGPITSIAVDPKRPSTFCTTSRDFTARIYDLTLTPSEYPQNPHWPPGTKPSLAGAAHGLQSTEPEGRGMGRCVGILVGGRSGGHQAVVLGAAFHPLLPLIATCGLDRAVKIWGLPPRTTNGEIVREDKPLFSSSNIHMASVLSITWLSDDMLLSHSAPAIMRKGNKLASTDTYLKEGTLVIWRWLGLNRFFPAHLPTEHPQIKVQQGCASDYFESSSFKIISVSAFPVVSTHHAVAKVQVYQSPNHDPFAVFVHASSTDIHMLNLTHLTPRKPPTFPLDRDIITEMAKRLRLVDEERDDGDSRAEEQISKIGGWRLNLGTTLALQNEELQACGMGVGGDIVVGLGSKGSLWIWNKS